MANNMTVIVNEQGRPRKAVKVASGATVRSALKAFGLDPEKLAGAVSLNGDLAELGSRIKEGDFISVTPKAAGGR